MAYVDSSGKTHVSLSEASRGQAAQTTASRNAAGQVVGSSSGSNYARAQEEQARAAEQDSVRNSIQYNTDTPAWATAPGETANIDRSQLQQFRTVDQLEAEKNKSKYSKAVSSYKKGYSEGKEGQLSLNSLKESVSSPGWKLEGQIIGKTVSVVENAIGEDRLKAYSTGYALGRGKEADINSLQAPKQRADKMVSYPLYQWTNRGTEYLSSLRDSTIKPLPDSTKDAIVGLSEIPLALVGAIGGVPMGLETIARNPTSVKDSIGLGLGLTAGEMVTTAEKEPWRFAGQLIGAYALGKVGGKIEAGVKEKLPSAGLADISLDSVKQRFPTSGLKDFALDERATLGNQKLVYKEQSFKSSKVKQEIESYVVVGDEIIPESSMKINSIQLSDDFILTAEMEEVLFGRSTKTPNTILDTTRLDTKLQRDIFSPELTQPTDYFISSIQAPEFAINSIKAVEFEGLMSRSQAVEVGGLMNRSQAIEVGGLMNRSQAVEVGGLMSRSQGVVIPSLAYSLPFAGQAITGMETKRERDSPLLVASLPVISLSSSQAGIQSLPEPTIQKEQGTNALYTPQLPDISPIEYQRSDTIIIPDTLPDIIPDIPNINDPLPPGNNPGGFTPFPVIPLPGSKKPVVFLDDSLDIFGGSAGKPKRRKTKQKTIKNTYGDPFKIKL